MDLLVTLLAIAGLTCALVDLYLSKPRTVLAVAVVLLGLSLTIRVLSQALKSVFGLAAVVTLAGILTAGCALTSKSPTPTGQADTRRQIADVIERLTLAEQLATEATKQLATAPIAPDLKTAIGCDILKAIGQDAPSATVTASCGRIPTRATAPLHVAVQAAETAGSCASRQNTIATALQVLQPVWERLQQSGVTLLQVLGGSLKFALVPLSQLSPCGGVA